MRYKGKNFSVILFAIFWLFSITTFMSTITNPVLAEDFSVPDGGFTDPGTSWVPPDAGMPADPSDTGMMGPGGPAMGDMMGPGMMGPGMTGPGMPPPEGSGWISDANGNWTPPADWTPPVGWTPPTGWQPGQSIPATAAPWSQFGPNAPGQMMMMTMPEGYQGLFGPGGPAIGDLQGISGVGSTGSIPAGMSTGIFGGSSGFFSGGIMSMTGATGTGIGMTGFSGQGIPPATDSGWTQGTDGSWTPPSSWTPPVGWTPPTGWQAGQPITEKDAPWNQIPAGITGTMPGNQSGYIPGTLVRLPSGTSLEQAMTNFDPNALGITLPSFMLPADFQRIMNGQATVDNMTQEMIKALNPGKFGPMSDPYIMSRNSGLSMDEMGNFFVQASTGAPGNPYIVKAKSLADEGKYDEALEALNDPNAPFNQFPDAMIHTWKAALAANAGVTSNAVQDIEKALALAPFDEKFYQQAGEIYKQAGITGPQVFVNGVKPEFDVKPFVDSGRTLVPFRALAETMGAEVNWDAETKTVTVLKGDKEINMVIGSNAATVNGSPVTLDVPPKVVDGRTVIPLRFVGESLDSEVGYNGDTKIIKILPRAVTTGN